MRSRFPLLVGSVVLGSCLSLTEPTDSCGSFLGRAGGVSSDSLSGCAFFTIEQPSGAFVMVLTNGDPLNTNPAVKVFRSAPPDSPDGRPALPGTYYISCTPNNLCGVAVLQQRNFTLTGTLVVTETDTLGITGSIDVTGTDALGATLTVRGIFVAQCKGQKLPFEQEGDPNNNTERFTPCRPSLGGF